MSAVEPSESSKGAVVDPYHGSSSVFMRKLKGFLGQKLELLELEVSSMNSTSSDIYVPENPKEGFQKKRSPRKDPSLVDGPFTADEISAAVSLLMLKEQNFSPQITCKEEDLVSAVPQISNLESYAAEENAFKKPSTSSSKKFPEKQRKRCQFEASAEGEVRAEKRAKKYLQYSFLQNSNANLPTDFKIRIRELTGSEEAVFVYEKKLFRTDVNSEQNRFLIPCKQVKNDFLTEKEKQQLKTNGGKITGKYSIEALLIEPSLEECKINFRKWDMGKVSGKVSENYVLVTTWNTVVRDNQLADGMTVHLWSFRRGNELCFALVNRGHNY